MARGFENFHSEQDRAAETTDGRAIAGQGATTCPPVLPCPDVGCVGRISPNVSQPGVGRSSAHRRCHAKMACRNRIRSTTILSRAWQVLRAAYLTHRSAALPNNLTKAEWLRFGDASKQKAKRLGTPRRTSHGRPMAHDIECQVARMVPVTLRIISPQAAPGLPLQIRFGRGASRYNIR